MINAGHIETEEDEKEIEASKSYLSKEIKEEINAVIFSGELKKKNKFFMKQERTFVLTKENRINYYKD